MNYRRLCNLMVASGKGTVSRATDNYFCFSHKATCGPGGGGIVDLEKIRKPDFETEKLNTCLMKKMNFHAIHNVESLGFTHHSKSVEIVHFITFCLLWKHIR